jgi:hypothetical protein
VRFKEIIEKPPPPLLFKYCGEWICDFLEDPCLYLSNPGKFNDPFDMAPTLRILDKRRAIEELDFSGPRTSFSRKKAEEEFSKRIKQEIPKDWRVYCLTENPENILMWSHYAEEHTGCVIGFNSEFVRAIQ